MEDNKEKKENKSLWKKFRDAGYGFIPMVIVSIICIGWMHYCEGGYYLVKKDHCVAVDDSIMKYSYNVSIIQDSDSIYNNYSTQQRHFLTQQEPADVSKGSYLSLWAATLAVIFVVFSIFGVLKLELTKDDIERKLKDIKRIDAFNKAQKAYHNIIVIIHESQYDNDDISRQWRLKEIKSLLAQYEEFLKGDQYDTVDDLSDAISAIYLDILNMKKISNEDLLYRIKMIIDGISKSTTGKTAKQLHLLGRCYLYKYRSTHEIIDLHRSINAYCLLCHHKDIANYYNLKYYEFKNNSIWNINEGFYLYELCQVLYEYPFIDGDDSGREFALKSAADIMEKLVNNIKNKNYEC